MTEAELTREVVVAALDWAEDLGPLRAVEQADGFYVVMPDGKAIKMHSTADRLIYAVAALRQRMRENAAGMPLP